MLMFYFSVVWTVNSVFLELVEEWRWNVWSQFVSSSESEGGLTRGHLYLSQSLWASPLGSPWTDLTWISALNRSCSIWTDTPVHTCGGGGTNRCLPAFWPHWQTNRDTRLQIWLLDTGVVAQTDVWCLHRDTICPHVSPNRSCFVSWVINESHKADGGNRTDGFSVTWSPYERLHHQLMGVSPCPPDEASFINCCQLLQRRMWVWQMCECASGRLLLTLCCLHTHTTGDELLFTSGTLQDVSTHELWRMSPESGLDFLQSLSLLHMNNAAGDSPLKMFTQHKHLQSHQVTALLMFCQLLKDSLKLNESINSTLSSGGKHLFFVKSPRPLTSKI